MQSFYRMTLLFAISLFPLLGFAQSGGIESLRQTGKAFSEVAQKVSPSVVFIQVESVKPAQTRSSPLNDDMLRRFFGDRFPGIPDSQGGQERRSMGQGSGFVFSMDNGLFNDKAYILTNSHVVEDAEKIRVTFKNGQAFDARVKGSDPKSDIAVLEIEADDIPTLELGDSQKLEVGEWVIAVGNPFGLSHTITAGIVSAKGRTSLGISDYEDFIQTDAAINPGNSGGPLVNLDGEVVGINTAIFSRSGGYMGVGFAIPINMARGIAEQLLNDGQVNRGFLGITIQNLTPDLAESFGVDNRSGILIAQVSADSPADRGGLKQGDLITEYQGRAVTDTGDFRNRVSLTQPGTQAKLKVIRQGDSKSLTVTIGQLDDQQVAKAATPEQVDKLGISVQTITADLARQFKTEAGKGVVITEVKSGSLAQRAGLDVGTVIFEVNRQAVTSADQFEALIDRSTDEGRVLLLIGKEDNTRFIVLEW